MKHAAAMGGGVMLVAWLGGCGRDRDPRVFQLLDPRETGISFANTIATSESLNVQTDVYIYNGAGVAVGDIDNDGLPDIFFSGNQVSSRLYLNKGGMRFEDITAQAGVTTNRWATGATMVDINNDGLLDIYVSVSGHKGSNPAERANLLFLNTGHHTFREAASQYGIADTGFTTHAVFLDYDRDGCLDLFLLNNSPADFSRGGLTANPSGERGRTPGSYNQLYHNDCHEHFTNVSAQAGILRDAGYGLGVAVDDVNGDGWPDIYVSNDGTPNDVLYINNRDGTFTNRAGQSLKHASYAGMGVDIADFNNDGWPDIAQADMNPRDLARRKRVSGFATYGTLLDSRAHGFRDDYSENSLQLNAGPMPDGDVIFSDVARIAGVNATDWSWSALLADFDNDGRKDLVITNGYPKAVNDLDYVNAMFALRRRGQPADSRSARYELLKKLPAYAETNYVFRNAGNLRFVDESRAWGFARPSFSYGAAYADLDNDGRLDLVVNNIDGPAFVYRNVRPADNEHQWLAVQLQGDSSNRRGVGAKVTIAEGGAHQYLYESPARGFMSSVDERLHFGVGGSDLIDSLEVRWPDGRSQVLANIEPNQILVVKQSDATRSLPAEPHIAPRPFTLAEWRFTPNYVQRLPSLIDYSVQPLLPYLVSRHGPALAVADVNGDGLDDVFIGGARVPGQLFVQAADGRFVAANDGQPWVADSTVDDSGALFVDVNGDGKPDLYVARGGYEAVPNSALLQDRLYINRGGSPPRFSLDSLALPTMRTSKGVVRAGDFNGDGRPDLFVGGRLTPRQWPFPTRSYVLRNEGGRFVDVTEEVAPALIKPGGMVTDAAWVDFDGDGKLDLVTVGEWMGIRFYRNEGGRFRDVTDATGLPPSRGWWYSLAVGDFDHDGRPDLVAGNLGLNAYKTSKDTVFGVYAGSMTGTQTTDVILTQAIDGVEYSLGGYSPLGREIYTLGLRYPSYGAFATVPITQLLTPSQRQAAVHYTTDTFASVLLRNTGKGTFQMEKLPFLAQIAPVKAIVVDDIDGDGNLDLVIGGNLFDTEPNTPPFDAGNGLWLRGDGKGHFDPIRPSRSGLYAPRNVSALVLLKQRAGKSIVIANVGDSLQTYTIKR